jgi:two-component system, OmpR family, sensor histidine kinase KdpD
MEENDRPDPDELLSRINESAPSGRARLKIFFGMCAGVGKTYTMLQEAKAARAAGADIVVALAETHGRAETEQLLSGMEILPLKALPYRGREFPELDLDGILERRPQTVVVDELPHSNAPGSRHVKRWQDVIEILDQGISVWTAMNVQHVESLADIVEDLSAAPVRERVPDPVLERADEIRLIDVAPEDLLERLEEGKVYSSDSARSALESFFRPRTLGALRDLALHYTARRAESALGAYSRQEFGLGPLPRSSGRILVAVGPSPTSAYLIRWARRTANSQRAEFTAVHVNTGARVSASDSDKSEDNLAFARKLGAETLVVSGEDVAETVLETARRRGATMVVVGRSGLSAPGGLPGRITVTDRIVREAGRIDVAIVQDTEAPVKGSPWKRLRSWVAAPAKQYALLAAVFAAVTGLSALLAPLLGYRSVALIYLAVILGLSFIADPAPIAVLALVSAASLNFFFIPPRFTFFIGSVDDVILFAVYFLVAIVTGSLVARLKSKEFILGERERRAAFLFQAAQELAERGSERDAAAAASRLAEEYFKTRAAILVSNAEGSLEPGAVGTAAADIDQKEFSAASYSFANGEVCGAGTDTLPSSKLRYLPASAGDSASAVIGIVPPQGMKFKLSDDNLLLSLGRVLALAVDRGRAESRSRRAALAAESQRLSTVLLDSVSHEIRTPLTTITGSITALRDEAVSGDPAARKAILDDALEASVRMDRIVEELLSMSRIESGRFALRETQVDSGELAERALHDASGELAGREVASKLPEGRCWISGDPALLSTLVSNLLRNAGTYSEAGKPIELAFEEAGDDATIRVIDSGPGIAREELDTMFERFTRGKGASGGGIGLGLAICKGIAEAHGGSVRGCRRADGRFEMVATLPGRFGRRRQ